MNDRAAAGHPDRSGRQHGPARVPASSSTTLHVLLAAALAIAVLAGVALTPGLAKTECVSVVKREQAGESRVVRYRNICSFPIWAVIKSGDTGRYFYRALNANAEAADTATKGYSQIVGWCKAEDADCLAEFGVRP